MNLQRVILAFVVMCSVIYSCSGRYFSSKSLNSKLNLLELNELVPAPELSMCMSYFMDTTYNLRCMINTPEVVVNWTKDENPLMSDGLKYKYSTDVYDEYRFVLLMIYNITSEDVGRYDITVENHNGKTSEMFYITPVEACDTLMRCFENTCVWPDKKTCNVEGARCVVDMCSDDANEWCMPKWFVGTKEVSCGEEDSDNSNIQQQEVEVDF